MPGGITGLIEIHTFNTPVVPYHLVKFKVSKEIL